MDERRIKRLVVMLIMAIVIIMLAKYMLTKAVTNVGNAVMEKKRAAAVQEAPVPLSEPVVTDAEPATASAVEASEMTSAVPATDALSHQ